MSERLQTWGYDLRDSGSEAGFEEVVGARQMNYEDGEVIGLDTDGCLIQWCEENGQPYNCGETPEEFGLFNLSDAELARVSR